MSPLHSDFQSLPRHPQPGSFKRMDAVEQRMLIADVARVCRDKGYTDVTASGVRRLDKIGRTIVWRDVVEGKTAWEVTSTILGLIGEPSPAVNEEPVSPNIEQLIEEEKPAMTQTATPTATTAPGQPDMAAAFAAFQQIFAPAGPAVDMDAVKKIVAEEIQRQTKRVEVVIDGGTPRDVGKQHMIFPKLLKLVGLRLNAFLIGPAGGGKTTLAMNVAKALDLPFEMIAVNAQTTKTDLLGYHDANSQYVESALYRRYKDGGVFLLDEVDAGNPNVLTTLNALLENGHGQFGSGGKIRVERHKDFVCIAAGNTFGRGADRIYVGRNQIDGASLDRFVNIEFSYDEALEREIAQSFTPAESADVTDRWVTEVQKLRHAAEELRERVVISPRASIRGARMLAAGFTRAEVLDMVVWKGIGRDIREKISNKAGL